MLAFMGLQINEVLVMGYLQQHNSIMIEGRTKHNTKKGRKKQEKPEPQNWPI
jgi:hypothetical protein